LLYEVIKDACEQGYFWFDFNPSGGHEGVKSFKKGFGCSTLQSNLYFHDSNIKKTIHLIANLKY
jgi:lipid II:glycine glycyltransferase (peptidoglycan interpeptide bridge formation enzyme)